MTYICISKLYHHWFRLWLVAWSTPSHYLNQCWNNINWTLRNKLQWNLNQNSYIFIQENAFDNVLWKMAAILSRPQCVNLTLWPYMLSFPSLYYMMLQGYHLWLFIIGGIGGCLLTSVPNAHKSVNFTNSTKTKKSVPDPSDPIEELSLKNHHHNTSWQTCPGKISAHAGNSLPHNINREILWPWFGTKPCHLLNMSARHRWEKGQKSILMTFLWDKMWLFVMNGN